MENQTSYRTPGYSDPPINKLQSPPLQSPPSQIEILRARLLKQKGSKSHEPSKSTTAEVGEGRQAEFHHSTPPQIQEKQPEQPALAKHAHHVEP